MRERQFMKRAFCIAIAALAFAGCDAPGNSADSPYSTGPASRGGTGVYYMDREIAGVMSYRGADWLERADRESTERTDLTLAKLPLADDSIVADIGAGSGYFARRIARLVPDGKVIAVDIQPEMLAILTANAAAADIGNIEAVLATEQRLGLEPGSIDIALMVDVYHELSRPQEVLLELHAALRPGGRLILIEYRQEDPEIPIIPVHKMSEQQVRLELEAAGLVFVENPDFLPQQHFLVFARPGDTG
jgi:ubiquinone/menaquinone biosynthesis C-methylase UbiE